MGAVTATTTRPRPFAERGPLGTWAVWVREQRQEHGWSEAELAAVLRGADDTDRWSVLVRRWEAGHWSPGEEDCRRLVAAFGTAPDGIEVPAATYARGAGHEEVPQRAEIADAFTTARVCLGYDPEHDPYRAHLDDASAAEPEFVDLTDLDAIRLQNADDEDGWEL